jgi:ribonuclease HI
MEAHNINIQWAPSHMRIEGNELADKLADTGALQSQNNIGLAAKPTANGIRSIVCNLREGA